MGRAATDLHVPWDKTNQLFDTKKNETLRTKPGLKKKGREHFSAKLPLKERTDNIGQISSQEVSATFSSLIRFQPLII